MGVLGFPGSFTAYMCTSRLAEGNQLQEAAVCAGSASTAPCSPLPPAAVAAAPTAQSPLTAERQQKDFFSRKSKHLGHKCHKPSSVTLCVLGDIT